MHESNDFFVISHGQLAVFGRAVLEAVNVPREAAAVDRLAGLLGRDPDWPGGP